MSLEENKSIIGEKIRQQRKRKNMTQFMLAEKAGLHEKQISRIESGLNYPTLVSFIRIISALDMEINDFSEENTKNINPLKDDLIDIIKMANDAELKIYSDILKPLHKDVKILLKK